MTTIRVVGGKELQAALSKMTAEMAVQVDAVTTATGLEIAGDIKKRYNRGPATGRVYQKHNPRRTHRASAPGQAPMTDTGRLAGSVTFREVGQASVSVESLLAYARHLEFGTFKIAPRPAWVPAAEAAAPKFQKRLERVLAEVLR